MKRMPLFSLLIAGCLATTSLINPGASESFAAELVTTCLKSGDQSVQEAAGNLVKHYQANIGPSNVYRNGLSEALGSGQVTAANLGVAVQSYSQFCTKLGLWNDSKVKKSAQNLINAKGGQGSTTSRSGLTAKPSVRRRKKNTKFRLFLGGMALLGGYCLYKDITTFEKLRATVPGDLRIAGSAVRSGWGRLVEFFKDEPEVNYFEGEF